MTGALNRLQQPESANIVPNWRTNAHGEGASDSSPHEHRLIEVEPLASSLMNDEQPSPEVLALRSRVSALEEQLAEHSRATNALVARSQEKLYWLERWQVDLDTVMRKPGAEQALGAVKGMRSIARAMRRALRALR